MRARLALVPTLLMAAAAGAQNQPLTIRFGGTWTLNIAKSSLHPPAPQSETITIEPSSTDTIATKYTVTGTTGDGKPINLMFEGKIDGQHYPVMSNGQEIVVDFEPSTNRPDMPTAVPKRIFVGAAAAAYNFRGRLTAPTAAALPVTNVRLSMA